VLHLALDFVLTFDLLYLECFSLRKCVSYIRADMFWWS
jgi:hypothetical protein